MSTNDRDKTNVIRFLEQRGIAFQSFSYDPSITDGQLVAKALNEDPDCVFKTLVTCADNGEHFVFVIPVNQTLNLRRAAKAVGVKSVEMIKQKELLPLTGYIHGGCSPLGMKKPFVTVVEEAATLFDEIYFSAGRVGVQIKLSPITLQQLCGCTFGDLI